MPASVTAMQRFVQGIRSYSSHVGVRQQTYTDLYKLYQRGEKLSVITAHDFITGKIAQDSDVNAVLIGDSLSMVAKGHRSTVELDFDDFYHTAKSVLRAVESKYVICDLPFGSFEQSVEKCVESSLKLMKLGKIGSVKLEGCHEIESRVRELVKFGIPVTGHLGLQPQKFNEIGGFTVQGKSAQHALQIYKDAVHLQKLGVKMIVLECIPPKLAGFITQKLNIPTIGIGAGNQTSGQVLVMADLLGMNSGKVAKFVKQYAQVYQDGVHGVSAWSQEVSGGQFPANEHVYKLKEDTFQEFTELVRQEES